MGGAAILERPRKNRKYGGIYHDLVPEIVRLHLAGNAPRRILNLLGPVERRGYEMTECNVAYILKVEGVYRPQTDMAGMAERGEMRRMHQRDKWLHANQEMIYRETEGTDW